MRPAAVVSQSIFVVMVEGSGSKGREPVPFMLLQEKLPSAPSTTTPHW
jgi:hypothetical protein